MASMRSLDSPLAALGNGTHAVELDGRKLSFQVREAETVDLGDVDPVKRPKAQ